MYVKASGVGKTGKAIYRIQSILAIRGGEVPRQPREYGKREYETFSLALRLDAIINYKNNKKRELREKGSSFSLLEPICDAAR
jgi:hypothetical protein